MKLYPIATKTFDHRASADDFIKFWQETVIPENTECYGVYFNYQNEGKSYDFAIATAAPNENHPIIIEDLIWYEKFNTTIELLEETWSSINRKGKQGLLRRAFTTDFEQYGKDGNVDVYISIVAHC